MEASSTFSLSPLSDGCTGGPSFAMERGLWADWEAISSKVSRTCSARTSSLSLIWTLIYKYNQHQFLLCYLIDRIAIFQNMCCHGVHKSIDSNIIDLPLNLAGVDYPNPWRYQTMPYCSYNVFEVRHTMCWKVPLQLHWRWVPFTIWKISTRESQVILPIWTIKVILASIS